MLFFLLSAYLIDIILCKVIIIKTCLGIMHLHVKCIYGLTYIKCNNLIRIIDKEGTIKLYRNNLSISHWT